MYESVPVRTSPPTIIKVMLLGERAWIASLIREIEWYKTTKMRGQDVFEVQVVGQANTQSTLWSLLETTTPDLVITELMLERDAQTGLDAVNKLKNEYPRVRCLVHTVRFEPEYFLQALRDNVDGYTLAIPIGREQWPLCDIMYYVYQGGYYEPELVQQLVRRLPESASVIAGHPGTTTRGLQKPLTRRELDTLDAFLKYPDYTDEQLGDVLHIGGDAVGIHLQSIREKFKSVQTKAGLMKKLYYPDD